MKKLSLTVFILLLFLTVLSTAYGERYKYSIGFCYMTPRTSADEALIREVTRICFDNSVEVVSFDAGDSLSLMTGFVDECLMDRGIYGLIILCSDQQTVDLIVQKSNEEKVPVSVLGVPPSDMDTLKAIAVTNNPVKGDEKLTALLLNKSGNMEDGVQPFFIPSGRDRDNVYINFLNLEKASWSREPVILNDNKPNLIKESLKENRRINMIILPADDAVKTVKNLLMAMGLWLPDTDPLHIYIGCMDASEETIKYMVDGYIDAIGTRDIVREAESLVNPLLTSIDERNDYPSFFIHVPGIVITVKDLNDNLKRAWIEGYIPEELVDIPETDTGESTVMELEDSSVDKEVVNDEDNERGPKNPREKKEKPPKEKKIKDQDSGSGE